MNLRFYRVIKFTYKEKKQVKLDVLRGLLSAFTNELVVQRKKPSEILEDISALKVVQREARKRKDSIEQFRKGGREDLVKKEEEELTYIIPYLPETMSKEEIEKIVNLKKEELGIQDKSKAGILMGAVMKELQGQADGSDVKEVVESLLS